MRTASRNPNNLLIYSVFFGSFLYLNNVAITKAQDIKPFPAAQTISPLTANIANEKIYRLTMTGATTTKDNQTLCTGFTLPDGSSSSPFWIIQFEGSASTSVVHHMTLYGCDTVQTNNPCGCGMPNRSPLYSWVRNTPKVRYTGTGITPGAIKGGFRIGGSSDKQFLFLEIHYCHTGTTNDQSGITIHTTTDNSNIYDLAIVPIMGLGTIPSGEAGYKMDTCITSLPAIFDGNTYIIGFQVHSHNLGRLIMGYFISGGNLADNIGQGNPLWPEAYIEIPYNRQTAPNYLKNHALTTRCIYDSRGASGDTNTNGRPKTTWSEMCILNLVVQGSSPGIQLNTKNAFLKGTCSSSALLDGRPESSTLLDSIPNLDIAAAYGNITSGTYTYGSRNNKINMGGETFTTTFG